MESTETTTTTKYRVLLQDDYEPWGDDGIEQEERENIEAGRWAPYVVVAIRVCDCCGTEIGWTDALHGCVTAYNADNEGVFSTPEQIPDEYLRSIAAELSTQDVPRTVQCWPGTCT